MPALRVWVMHQNFLLLYYNIFKFKRLNQRSHIGRTHLKMTTRARVFCLLKNWMKSENRIMSIQLYLFKIRFTAPIQSFLFFLFRRLCGLLLNCLLLIFGAKLSVAKFFYYRIGKAKLIFFLLKLHLITHASEFFLYYNLF